MVVSLYGTVILDNGYRLCLSVQSSGHVIFRMADFQDFSPYAKSMQGWMRHELTILTMVFLRAKCSI